MELSFSFQTVKENLDELAEQHGDSAVALKSFAPCFQYGGEPFPACHFSECRKTSLPGKEIYCLASTSADGLLRYSLKITLYPEYRVVEWLPELENIGAGDTARISDFQSLNYSQFVPTLEMVKIERNVGSQGRQDDYLPDTVTLQERMNHHLVMATTEGRSSHDWLPYFNVRISERLFRQFAIGWSGAWKATFSLENENLAIQAGLRKTDFVLHPREKIRQPAIFMMEHSPETESDEAHNDFRSFMRCHHSPHDRTGKLIQAPISFSCGGGIPEKMLTEMLDFLKAERIPVEVLWMDAGWYGADHPGVEPSPEHRSYGGMINETLGNWHAYRGDWRVNHGIHSKGLKFYADKARENNMGFLLWFELERIMPEAPVVKEHPEWLLTVDGSSFVLNLGLPEAVQMCFDILREKVENECVSIIRIDFNIDTIPFWDSADAPDRIGITETKYIMGLYDLWDRIRAMLPDSPIDNCASGGQRLDFEALSRSIPLWRVDGAQTAESHQIQVSELSRWVPQHAAGLYGSPMPIGDDYVALSLCATGTQLSYFTDQMAPNPQWLRKICGDIRTLRRGFLQNMYHLTEEVWDKSKIHALQCDSPEHDRGLVIVFRRTGQEDSCRLPLRYIDDNASYEVTVNGQTECLSGTSLRQHLYSLPETHSVCLLTYGKRAVSGEGRK